jgi:anaerobic magnesium-protoporphyrin IX monomethyl ester cyclase
MRVVLIGADFEENLGIGMLAAVARSRGHDVRIEPFNTASQTEALAKAIAAFAPDVVGLGIQFQHRSYEFLALATALRRAGFAGHLTTGGQFPSLAFAEVLDKRYGVDSVVFHDGERTFGELLDALVARSPLGDVAGLALRDASGAVVRTAARPLTDDLDSLPFAERYRPHAVHCGVPFIPIMGSRGCWGHCSYCSITTHYRDAREHGGGKTFRLRSPENVAEEMAILAKRAGGPCIFCFHDDNLLLPRPSDTIARLRAIRDRLDALGIGKVGIIGKCRPETVTVELAAKLRELGVIRLYVGVENASERGAEHLGRGKQHLAIDAALDACRKNGIFTCYNLLVFEPEATIADVETNLAFIRRHGDHPVNFCRAEPYHGTPLQQELLASGGLGGSYLGYDYRIGDDRTELLFRITAAVFRERNFRPDGVANRYMGLGYNMKILEHFYEDPGGERARIARRIAELTRRITLDTATYLERAVELAKTADLSDRDAIERRAARLGLEIAATDAFFHRELDGAYAAFEAFSRRIVRPRAVPPVVSRVLQRVAIGTSLAIGALAPACGGKTSGGDSTVSDPLPSDDGSVVQPPSDPLPSDAGIDTSDSSDAAEEPDVNVVDPPPPDAGMDALLMRKRLPLIDQWRDTSPKRSVRSDDLPFFEPPDVRLTTRREGDAILASLQGGPDAVSLRWEGDGAIEGDGREVRWVPGGADDGALRVAVRARGGLAFLSVRARSVSS